MIEQYVDMNAKLYRISCVNISFNTCTLDWRSACDSCLICSKVSCSLSVVGIIHVPANTTDGSKLDQSTKCSRGFNDAQSHMCIQRSRLRITTNTFSYAPPAENMSKKELRGISLNDVLVKKRSLLLPSLPTWPRSP